MDKATIKLVLGAYRGSRKDTEDAFFAEALREVERDPELAGWFEEERRFDALMVETLKGVPTPAGLKESILLNGRSAGKSAASADETPTRWRRDARNGLAMAAGLALAFFLGRQTLPRAAQPVPPAKIGGADRLASQAIAYTARMPALQFVCFDAAVVAKWVEEKATTLKMGKVVGTPMPNMQMIGSSAAQWEGKPVIMIALQNGDQMAMLYLVRASDFPGALDGIGEIMEKDGWVSRTGRNGDHLYVLTTKGTRANLRFPMPL